MSWVAQQFLEHRVRACVVRRAVDLGVVVDAVVVDTVDAVHLDRPVTVIGDAEAALVHVRLPLTALPTTGAEVGSLLRGAVSRALAGVLDGTRG